MSRLSNNRVQNHIKMARAKKITEEMTIKKTNNKEMIRLIMFDGLVERRPPYLVEDPGFFERGRET